MFLSQNYAYTLAKQLEVPKAKEPHKFGKEFGVKDLELLTEDQTLQLVELFRETHPGVMKEPVAGDTSDSVDDTPSATPGGDGRPPVDDLPADKTELKDRQTVANPGKPS